MIKYLLGIVLSFLVHFQSYSQAQNYFVARAPFSSDIYDDFSPVFYNDGVVFCSNRNQKLFGSGYNGNTSQYFRLHYADTSRAFESRLLEGVINSRLNSGPASFSPRGDTIYFSRNLIVDGSFKELSSPDNKLGLFSAVVKNGKWEDVQELRFNDNSWNVTTPSLSRDGKRLYFASDKPGGFGGSDIYYSVWRNGYWDNPVNLGPVINTEGNEAYPFVSSDGGLFFSSDTHPGKGGKDIFFSMETDTAWIKPVSLSAPVNSSGNDFGFVADDLMKTGYFSSDRNDQLDIFSFKTLEPEFLYCIPQRADRYCYTFMDDGQIGIDRINLEVRWDFGEDKSVSGNSVRHCFKGPGRYLLKQNIVERRTGNIVFNKLMAEIEIYDDGLPFIILPDKTISGQELLIRAEPDNSGFETLSYYWKINDEKVVNDDTVLYKYDSSSPLQIKLLTYSRNINTGQLRQSCIVKSVESGNIGKDKDSVNSDSDRKNLVINNLYSYSDEITRKPVFAVQITESSKPLSLDDEAFDRLGPQYTLKRISLEKSYSYIIAEETDFMAAYSVYNEAVASGFRNAIIRTYIPSSPGETDLWDFKRMNSTSSDQIFVNNGYSISPDAVELLDKLILLLRRHQDLKIKIVAYTERTSDMSQGIELSTRQAQSILNYLVSNGISSERLSSEGYGGSRPVAPDYPESERLKNRRVDFIAITDSMKE